MIVDGTGFGIFNIDIITQIDHTAIGHNIKEDIGCLHSDHQRTEFHLVQGIMGHTLLEHHLGIEFAGPGENYLVRFYTECSPALRP